VIAEAFDIRVSQDELSKALKDFWKQQRVATPFGMQHWFDENRTNADRLMEIFIRQIKLQKALTLSRKLPQHYFMNIMIAGNAVKREVEYVESKEKEWHERGSLIDPGLMPDECWLRLLKVARRCVNDVTESIDLESISRERGYLSMLLLIQQLFKEHYQEIVCGDSSSPEGQTDV